MQYNALTRRAAPILESESSVTDRTGDWQSSRAAPITIHRTLWQIFVIVWQMRIGSRWQPGCIEYIHGALTATLIMIETPNLGAN